METNILDQEQKGRACLSVLKGVIQIVVRLSIKGGQSSQKISPSISYPLLSMIKILLINFILGYSQPWSNLYISYIIEEGHLAQASYLPRC